MQWSSSLVSYALYFFSSSFSDPSFQQGDCMGRIRDQMFMKLITEVQRRTPTIHHRIGPGQESLIKPPRPAANPNAMQEEEEEEEKKETEVEMKSYTAAKTKHEGKSSTSAAAKSSGAPAAGWTARGLPVGDPREQRGEWNSNISSCLGKNDEFYSSDVEVCVMGCCAPCVLHGSNAERLGSGPGSFATHCLPYAGLYLIGNCFFGWNCLAPWFSYPNRTAIRRKFNLEGSCEVMARSIGCSRNIRMNEDQREHCESACDMVTHVMCHPCSLCQETRELRRRLPHPGFSAKPVIVMLPPGAQTMGR